MDYKFWIPVVGTIAQIAIGLWGVRLQMQTQQEVRTRPEKRRGQRLPWYRIYWPILAMAACMVGTWIPYFSSRDTVGLPSYLLSWGTAVTGNVRIDQLTTLREVADGRLLASERKRSRVAGVAFHYFGLGDVDDVADLQKSGLYDIRDEDIPIIIPLSQSFIKEMMAGSRGTSYRLLLVPNGVTMDKFSTLHEAASLGVRVIGLGSGPP